MKIFVLFFCTLAFVVEAEQNVNPIVQTRNGAVKGSILKTRLGKDIYSFRGVRYANAPTGRNRFKDSTPVQSHTGIFDATQEGPSCPQFATDNRPIAEDCLRLNIYTTALPQLNSPKRVKREPNRDVIVFLQPGAFYTLSGTYDFGPDNFLEKNIVLVTLNYRLGSLGFMSTGDERAPGNGGLKDQVLALRWIRDNIRNFGGNPNSVTLLGYSAGGWSIGLHMLSPMSKGLFHRAIAMSGSPITLSPLPFHQRHLAMKQARLLDCPIDNEDKMFDCLYEKPVEDFVKSLSGFGELSGDPVPIWSPVIEQQSCNNSREVFLTGQPIDLIRQKKGNFVPLIIGVNRDEIAGFVIIATERSKFEDNSIYHIFNSRWEEVAPLTFLYEHNTSRSHGISRELKSFYLKGQPLGSNNIEEFGELFADALTIFPTHRFERLMTQYSTAPVYNYFYDFEGCQTFTKWSNGKHFGVGHHDELLILFRVIGYPPLCDKDVTTLNRLTRIIKDFANTGTPIPSNSSTFPNINWQPNSLSNPKYLKISRELSIQNGIIYEMRMIFLDQLFFLPPITNSNNQLNCN